jgi:hypothetical protein
LGTVAAAARMHVLGKTQEDGQGWAGRCRGVACERASPMGDDPAAAHWQGAQLELELKASWPTERRAFNFWVPIPADTRGGVHYRNGEGGDHTVAGGEWKTAFYMMRTNDWVVAR